MDKTNSHWKLILVICLAVVALGIGIGNASRPQNPTMDYVPQNVGVYDTCYTYFNEPECRTCHGVSTAERHHHTVHALNNDCLYCHYGYPITVPTERDCKVCHTEPPDGASIIPNPGEVGGGGDLLGYPHHKSDLADSWQCTGCHNPNLLSETYTVAPPNYEVSDITPTPGACENCHWQSDIKNVGGHTVGAVYPGNNAALFQTDWETWIGIPKPTSYNDGFLHPAPIMANGIETSGALWAAGTNRFGVTMPAKPWRESAIGTHEQPGMVFYSECYLCHSRNPDDSFNTDPNNPENMRMCENCHDIYTLHGIEQHVTTDNIYTVGGVLNQTVYSEPGKAWKCVACHGNNMPAAPEAAVHPAILPLEIDFGSPGVVFDIAPDAVSFGLRQDGDSIQMCQPSTTDCSVNTNWENVPIYSWDEHLIRARVPGWTFAPDLNAKVRVHKQGATGSDYSNQKNFTIRKHPEITTLAPSAGQYGENVIIYGQGFYTGQKSVPAGGYGFYTYVQLTASNDTYRATKYTGNCSPGDPIDGWDSTDIGACLKNLLDLKTGAPIPTSLASLLYVGNWSLTVVTDYFIDDGDGVYMGTDGKLDLDPEYVEAWNLADGPNSGTTGDTLIWRETSTPSMFNVDSNPAIWNINSTKIPAGDSMKITGINFGASQGTSKVRVGACGEIIGDLISGTLIPIGDEDGKCEGWTEMVGDGRGNDNGICEANEPCQKEACEAKVPGSKIATVKTWSTTKVVAKVPSFGTTGYPKKKCVQIELGNGKKSNGFIIKILAP
jgi:hypothetical protein